MHDDNPLWYDYAEPEPTPDRLLLALAGLFCVATAAARASARLYRMPDRLWCWAARASRRTARPHTL